MLLTTVVLKKVSFTPLDGLNEWKSGEHCAEPTFCSNARKVLQIGKQNVNIVFFHLDRNKIKGRSEYTWEIT